MSPAEVVTSARRRHRRLCSAAQRLFFGAACALFAACAPSSPSFDGTSFQCSDGSCPSGFECIEAVCVPDGTRQPDAGSDGDSAPGGQLPDLIVDGETVEVGEGTYRLNALRVINGGTLVFSGALVIEAVSVEVDADSAIDGNGGGFGAEMGPGTGTTGVGGTLGTGGGGGGHGGRGGHGGYDPGDTIAGGGRANGNATLPEVDMGSGGGNATGSNAIGGAGGGALTLTSPSIEIAGAVRVNGANGEGSFYGGGGGAGGGILLIGDVVTVSGVLSARGGNGGKGRDPTENFPAGDGGGGGGGGRIKVIWGTSFSMTGTFNVDAGNGRQYGDREKGENGAGGSTHDIQRPFVP